MPTSLKKEYTAKEMSKVIGGKYTDKYLRKLRRLGEIKGRKSGRDVILETISVFAYIKKSELGETRQKIRFQSNEEIDKEEIRSLMSGENKTISALLSKFDNLANDDDDDDDENENGK